MEYKNFEFEGIGYVVRYPDGYTEGEKYPTILHLHGAGSRGTDLAMIRGGTFFRIVDQHQQFPFVVVAPQCNETCWFDAFERLKRLAGMVSKSDFCDPLRFYLMGLSMGGYAAWQLAVSCPELFAALVPICGGGMSWITERLVNIPIWAFHGAKDATVHPDESRFMVNKVNLFGGRARLTVYEDAYHDAWSPTYANYEVFEWMLKQKKTSVTESEDGFRDSKRFG